MDSGFFKLSVVWAKENAKKNSEKMDKIVLFINVDFKYCLNFEKAVRKIDIMSI